MVKQLKNQKKGRVLVGLSGGVDSAVSAYLLLKAGYEVEGAFMKNWSSTAGLKLSECPWLADRQEALRVAAFLGIPLHTLDFEKQYSERVMSYFFKEYQAGRTPNPDVMCNKEIKFKLLYDFAMKHGFDFLATGHYAQVTPVVSGQLSVVSKTPGKAKAFNRQQTTDYRLLRSRDEFKDQTYFIYNIKTEQLSRVLFPIGGMKKTEVKKLAKKIGLPNANRKESMGLCFVGKIRLKDFLEQKVRPKKGKIVLLRSGVMPGFDPASRRINLDPGSRMHSSRMTRSEEVVIGQHQGLHLYTVGQRQGINVGGPGGPYYVVKKDLAKNILYVTNNANDPALEVSEVSVHSVNWISKLGENFQFPISNFQCYARYRHQGELVRCTVNQISKDTYTVKFKTPQKALASGQSVVFYNGKVCVGGGVIG